MPGPKVIHFIWGGATPPKLDPLLAWQKKNPNFAVVMWMSERSASSGSTAEYEKHGITVKDSGKALNAPVDDHMAYVIQPERPNYGAAADAVRYAALEKFGGMYFDADEPAAPAPGKDQRIGNDAFIVNTMAPLVNVVLKKVLE